MKYSLEDLTDIISDLIGLKNLSKATTIDMATELSHIVSHTDYIKFIKSQINVVGMEYLPAYQRFIKLTEQYKRKEQEELNRNRIEKMGTAAERLASKVKEIDTIVLNAQNDNHQWEKFKLSTGEQYFGEKEIAALRVIGSPITCVRLQRSISGRDMLCERLEALFVERVMYPQLEAPIKPMNLIGDLAKEKEMR